MVEFRRGAETLRVLLVESDLARSRRIAAAFERFNRRLLGDGAPAASRCLPGETPMRLYAVAALTDALTALQREAPHLVIASRQLRDGDGIELLSKPADPPFPVVLISDQPGERLAVDAIKAGAIDYRLIDEQTPDDMPEIATAALHAWHRLVEHKRLQMEVVAMPQREQQRLVQELHDGLGQQLTGLGLLAKSLARRLARGERHEQQMADQLASGLEEALAEVRSLSRGLIPVHTDARGLVSALEDLAQRISEQSGIQVELRHEAPILITDNEIATHVYRIVQEAINNSIKHAQADRIVLTLEADEHEAIIEVCDNGRGLPEDVDENEGLGLRTMFHRCQLFGGNLDVYTHDAGGTRVRCCFPLSPARQVS